ncbi:MAG: hypothetical protein JNM88_03305 [Chitinophagaceae bacterium]|nr:hypothetical protein [Chitinophagaceae bacterium]
MRKLIAILPLLTLVALCGHSQLFVDNATLFIQSGASVVVQGDVTSNVDIQGPGKIVLKGSANQNVNMNGFTIPNLEMDNTANATLTGNARIGTSMLFTNGKIIQGNFNVRLSDIATSSGGGAGKFFETTGTGQLVKEVSSNLTNYVMPLGSGAAYYPASLTTSGSYSSASVGTQVKGGADPNKHPRSTDYLNLYWPLTRTGITGTLNVSGNYNANFSGTETELRGIFWNGTNWVLAGGTINTGTDDAAAPVTGNGNLYAMNRFLLSRMRVMLQGAFNGTDMNDNLRAGTNLIPLTDPYRSAPYNTSFTHVNNPVTEVANATVFNNAALTGDNIVDWVFLELRDNSGVNPGATVVQTRAAFVQRDGDIVDIDGVSPVYFKNLDAGASYTLAVRHRNHLGIATDPVANLQSLSEATPGSTTDFSTMVDAQIFGTSAAYTTSGGRTLLWGGNVNGNTNSRYQGAGNDRAVLLTDLGSNELTVLTNVYNRSDINMNRTVRYQGAANDRAFLLSTVLGAAELTVRTQALPL